MENHIFIENPQYKLPKLEERKEIEMPNIDLDKANAEMYEEIRDLKQQIVELKAMNIENLQYKDKIHYLIEKWVLNEDGEEIIKF